MTQEMPDALFEAHRYLCRRGARRFVRGGLDRTDLEQVAAIGLLKACRRYDARKQTPFEAFAWLMILGELMHHVRDFEHLVRPPRWVRALEPRYAAALERLQQRLQREPRDAEIAAELNVASSLVTTLRGAQRSRAHEQVEAARGAACEPGDPLDRVLVDCALAAVDPAAREVVVGIYALGLSRNEIARRTGISPRCVARLHDDALERMRLALCRP